LWLNGTQPPVELAHEQGYLSLFDSFFDPFLASFSLGFLEKLQTRA
jgi:hypothetical protein